jgi:hypothetical protein
MASVAEARASSTFLTYLAGGLTVIVESAFLRERAVGKTLGRLPPEFC